VRALPQQAELASISSRDEAEATIITSFEPLPGISTNVIESGIFSDGDAGISHKGKQDHGTLPL